MSTAYYLDTSVAAGIVLAQSRPAATWFADTASRDDALIMSSRLLRVELTRVLRREQLDISRRDDIVDYIRTISVDDHLMSEAERILPHVKTLDAIHLAALMRSGVDDAVLVTHDDTMSRVGALLGYRVFDPMAPA